MANTQSTPQACRFVTVRPPPKKNRRTGSGGLMICWVLCQSSDATAGCGNSRQLDLANHVLETFECAYLNDFAGWSWFCPNHFASSRVTNFAFWQRWFVLNHDFAKTRNCELTWLNLSWRCFLRFPKSTRQRKRLLLSCSHRSSQQCCS